MIDDAHVRLVRHIDVNLVDGNVAFVQNLLCGVDEHARCELEDLPPVHLRKVLPRGDRLSRRRRARAAGGHVELLPARAVRAELETEETAFRHPLEDDRARAVAEEDARAAVLPVDDSRKHVAADDERVVGQAASHHPVRLSECVDEARAAGRQVVRGRVLRA